MGRRTFLIFASLITLVGGAGQAGAKNLAMFIAFRYATLSSTNVMIQAERKCSPGSRLINGFAVGILTSIVPSFVAEISKPHVRGLMMSLELCIASTGLVSQFDETILKVGPDRFPLSRLPHSGSRKLSVRRSLGCRMLRSRMRQIRFRLDRGSHRMANSARPPVLLRADHDRLPRFHARVSSL